MMRIIQLICSIAVLFGLSLLLIPTIGIVFGLAKKLIFG